MPTKTKMQVPDFTITRLVDEGRHFALFFPCSVKACRWIADSFRPDDPMHYDGGLLVPGDEDGIMTGSMLEGLAKAGLKIDAPRHATTKN